MHRALRRLAALLVLAIPVSFIGRAGATWGPPPPAPPRRRARSRLRRWRSVKADEERAESAVVLVVLDGVRWQEVFGGADRALARERGLNPLAWASPRTLLPNVSAPARDTRDRARRARARRRHCRHRAAVHLAAGVPGDLRRAPRSGLRQQRLRAPTGAHLRRRRARFERRRRRRGGRLVAEHRARGRRPIPSRLVADAGRHRVEAGRVLRADEATAALLDAASARQAVPGRGRLPARRHHGDGCAARPDDPAPAVSLRGPRRRRRVRAPQRLPRLPRGHPRFRRVPGRPLRDARQHGGARAAHDRTRHGGPRARLRLQGPRCGAIPSRAASGCSPRAATSTGTASSPRPRRHTLSDVAPTVRALLGIRGEGDAHRRGRRFPGNPRRAMIVVSAWRIP